ncbi:MAG: hypothetical protein ACOX3R_02435 [Desulfitobacteriia bacterium]
MTIDPIKATKTIEDSYISYLSTAFPLREPDLHNQFVKLLKVPGKFIKGPILEATPSFETGLYCR